MSSMSGAGMVWKLALLGYSEILLLYTFLKKDPGISDTLAFWSLCSILIYSFFSLVGSVSSSPSVQRFASFMQAVAFSFSMLVVTCLGISYRSLVFPGDSLSYRLLYHMIPAVLMLVDLIISPTCFEMPEVFGLLAIVVLYVLFDVYIHLLKKLQIYPWMNWENGHAIVAVLIGTLGLIFFFTVGLIITNVSMNIQRATMRKCSPQEELYCIEGPGRRRKSRKTKSSSGKRRSSSKSAKNAKLVKLISSILSKN